MTNGMDKEEKGGKGCSSPTRRWSIYSVPRFKDMPHNVKNG